MRTPPVNPDVNDIADRAKYWHARSAEMSPNPLSDIAYPNLHEITAGANHAHTKDTQVPTAVQDPLGELSSTRYPTQQVGARAVSRRHYSRIERTTHMRPYNLTRTAHPARVAWERRESRCRILPG